MIDFVVNRNKWVKEIIYFIYLNRGVGKKGTMVSQIQY